MKKDLELELVNKYPDICRNYGGDEMKTCFHWGFECGDGWYNLIDSCLNKINSISKNSNLPVQIEQVKSKFGRLVIYLEFDSGPKGPHVKQAMDLMWDATEEARKLSQNTSQISGLPASSKVINHKVVTVTDAEADKLSKDFLN